MIKNLVVAAGLAGMVASVLPTAPPQGASSITAPASEISWTSDVAAAELRARSEGRPLLLVFRCER